MSATKQARPVAADTMLHPVVVVAVAALIVNDHFLKPAFPGAVSGKLSDVAGLAFFPLLLAGSWELALLLTRRWKRPSALPVLIAAAATAIGFSMVKLTEPGAHAFGAALGLGQWLPSAAIAALTRGSLGSPTTAPIVADPTDLIALPAILIPLFLGLRRARDRRLPDSPPTGRT